MKTQTFSARYALTGPENNLEFIVTVVDEFFTSNEKLNGLAPKDFEAKYDMYTLLKDFEMGKFLHNERGPALDIKWHSPKRGVVEDVIIPEHGKYQEFWIHTPGQGSKRLMEEEAQKIIHNGKFADKVEEFINE